MGLTIVYKVGTVLCNRITGLILGTLGRLLFYQIPL